MGLSRDSQVDGLAVAVAGGKSVRAAATELGINLRTAQRMTAEAGFRERVESLRGRMVNEAVGSLASAAVEAVSTLKELLGPATPAPTRLGAARAILSDLIALRDHDEFAERLAKIEEKQRELDDSAENDRGTFGES